VSPEISSKRRWLFICTVGLFMILVFRLLQLQVIGWEHYFGISEENRVRVVPIPAPRGLIFDRNGQVLVDNRASYTISLLPFQLKDMEETVGKVSKALGIDILDLKGRFGVHKTHPYEPVKLKRDVGIKAVSVIEEHRYSLPGVIYQVEPTRSYPFGTLAAHLLGHVGEISDDQLSSLRQRGYLLGELVGKAGIEREYEHYLHGINGTKYLEVDALGREIGELPGKGARKPQPGFNLYLTIDWRIQRVAEQAFSDTLTGALVAIDPRNGEVLVFVSRPNFDPNIFSGVLSPAIWDSLNSDPRHPLLNRAIQSAYPPASTLKMVTAIAALEMGLIDENTKLAPCTGSYKFGNRWYGCWKEEGHGALSLIDAIAQSCDVYFYQLGLKVGLKSWNRYARKFGFGTLTGIDLPGEIPGLVPSDEYYDQRYGKGKWTRGLLLNLVIGQGEILVTPVQMVQYIAAIATGKIPQIHLLKEIVSDKGETVFRPNIKNRKLDDISPATFQLIRKALLEAVEGEKGTGRFARVRGFQIAGKTGTAQNPRGEDHAWFAAYAPFEEPRIAVAAIVEGGGHGAVAAAPLVKKVLEAYLNGTRVQATSEPDHMLQ